MSNNTCNLIPSEGSANIINCLQNWIIISVLDKRNDDSRGQMCPLLLLNIRSYISKWSSIFPSLYHNSEKKKINWVSHAIIQLKINLLLHSKYDLTCALHQIFIWAKLQKGIIVCFLKRLNNWNWNYFIQIIMNATFVM